MGNLPRDGYVLTGGHTAFLFWYLVALQEEADLGSGLVPWGCGEFREESGMEGV